VSLRSTHVEELNEDGRAILKLLSKKCGVRVWSGFKWLRISP
jgi:hypothetical protein